MATPIAPDVSMAAGKASGDTAQLVANGAQDFGLNDAVSIAAGRTKGLRRHVT